MTGDTKGYIAGGGAYSYEVAPKGQTVLLLTRHGVCIKGTWYGAYGEHFWGWAPLPVRNKEREAELGLTSLKGNS